MSEHRITSAKQLQELWGKTYNKQGCVDWSHILPYYDDNIVFYDSVQTITGKAEFIAMTKRLAKRAKNLSMKVCSVALADSTAFVQWEMTISFQHLPSTRMYGCSCLSLNQQGKIFIQRDYYDLWGDIYRSLPFIRRIYGGFMKKVFG